MVKVTVTGGEISEQEKAAYIEHVLEKNKNTPISHIDIEIDGDYVNLRYSAEPQPFNRIRRITGYLVGDVTRWNNAKRKELSERTMSISADPKKPMPQSRISKNHMDALSEYAKSLI